MRKPVFLGSLLLALGGVALACGSANAADYVFNVDYLGGNNAVLAAGSQDPVGTTLEVGDSFTYILTGANGVFSTTTGGSIFPFIALAVNESGTRTSDFSVTLSDAGATVFSFADTQDNQYVHVGANTVTLPGNLVFDRITLTDTILASDVDSTINSILPIFGSPDQNPYYPGVVHYSGDTPAVPEAATWAMMLVGFGMVGAGLRYRRKSTAVRFA